MGLPNPGRLLDLRPRVGLRGALLIVALAALALGTAKYRRENRDVDRSSVTWHLKHLRQGEPKSRGWAVDGLAASGAEELERVAPALLDVLGDSDPDVRLAAARAWVKVAGLKGSPELMTRAIAALTSATADPDARVRAAAVETLGGFGQRIGQTTPGERAKSMLMEPSVDPLLRALEDPSPQVRIAAARASLGVLALGGAAPEGLIAMVRDEDRDVRSAAYAMLRDNWRNHREIEAALLPIVLRGDGESYDAAGAMSSHGPPSDEALDAVLRLVNGDGDISHRILAFCSLADYGSAARRAMPVLVASLEREGDDGSDWYVAWAMVHIDPAAPETLEVLRRVVEREVRAGPKEGLYTSVPFLLGESGQAGRALIPWLQTQVEDPDPGVRDRAVGLLRTLGVRPVAQAGPPR